MYTIYSNYYCVVHNNTRPKNSAEAETEHLFLGLKSLKQYLAYNRLWKKKWQAKKKSTISISILEGKGTFITALWYNKKHCSKS